MGESVELPQRSFQVNQKEKNFLGLRRNLRCVKKADFYKIYR